MSLENVFNNVSAVLPLFYNDKIDVNRRTKITESDGSSRYDLPDTPLIQSVDCSISYQSIDNPDKDDVAKNPKVLILEIFLSNSTSIQKGDTITAYKYNSDRTQVLKTFQGIANDPVIYPTHQQVSVVMKGNA